MKKRWAIASDVEISSTWRSGSWGNTVSAKRYLMRPPRVGFTRDYRAIWRFKTKEDAEKAAFALALSKKGDLFHKLEVVKLPGKIPLNVPRKAFRARVKRGLGVKVPDGR